MTAFTDDCLEENRRLVAPELLGAFDAFPRFDINEDLLPLFRQGMTSLPKPVLSDEQQSVRVEQHFVPGPAGAPEVRILVYTPPRAQRANNPVYLHVHGGGYVLGAPEMSEATHRQIALELSCIVVAVNYRLAPEAPFPAALNDCYAVLSWLHQRSDVLGVDRSRIAIGGESAGAGHAAALALHARDKAEFEICLQVLDSPMLDDRTGTTRPAPPRGCHTWSVKNNLFGWQSLLGMPPGGDHTPRHAAPGRTEDLGGLPPTFIVVGALDLFAQEDIDYARRLIEAGVPTELHVIPGAFHGFAVLGPSPQARTLHRLRCEALKRAFAV